MAYRKPDVSAAFGLVLRRYRKERDLTQSDLAAIAGVHINTVSLLERGKIGPALDIFLTLAAALDVTPSELVRETKKELGE
jgi:transcriptional regulator with XRE-family HTH domain